MLGAYFTVTYVACSRVVTVVVVFLLLLCFCCCYLCTCFCYVLRIYDYDGNDEQDAGDEHGGDGLRRRPGRKRTKEGR